MADNTAADEQLDIPQIAEDSLESDHFTVGQNVAYNAVTQSIKITENEAEDLATDGNPISHSDNEDDT